MFSSTAVVLLAALGAGTILLARSKRIEVRKSQKASPPKDAEGESVPAEPAPGRLGPLAARIADRTAGADDLVAAETAKRKAHAKWLGKHASGAFQVMAAARGVPRHTKGHGRDPGEHPTADTDDQAAVLRAQLLQADARMLRRVKARRTFVVHPFATPGSTDEAPEPTSKLMTLQKRLP